MKIFLCVVFISLSFLLFQLNAQSLDTVWTKTYGYKDHDYGKSIQLTNDDGFIITGIKTIDVTNNPQVWLLKLDDKGDTLWTKSYGAIGSDYGNCVIQTNDNGYAITGFTQQMNSSWYDVFLIKTDSIGLTEWIKTFNIYDDEQGKSVKSLDDGGYIISGSSYFYCGFLIRTNPKGDTLWTMKYYKDDFIELNDVVQTKEGNFITVGHTGGNINLIIGIDSNGNIQWSKEYKNGHGLEKIKTTSNNEFICVGGTLLKINASGEIIWETKLNGYGYSVTETVDKGYLVIGSGIPDINLLKIIQFDSAGNIIDSLYLENIEGRDVSITSEKNYIIVGTTKENYLNNLEDINVICVTTQKTPIEHYRTSIPGSFRLLMNYPNPFNSSTNIQYNIIKKRNVNLKIISSCGSTIKQFNFMNQISGTYSVVWNGNDQYGNAVASGIYFCSLFLDGTFIQSHKMIFIK